MRAAIFLLIAALAGCTANVTGATVELAREKCAPHGGIGSLNADSMAFDAVRVYCGNGTVFVMYRGAPLTR